MAKEITKCKATEIIAPKLASPPSPSDIALYPLAIGRRIKDMFLFTRRLELLLGQLNVILTF